MRNLLVTRRTVPPASRDPYDRAWSALLESVQALNLNVRRQPGEETRPTVRVAAWRFRRQDRADLFIEFVEWSGAGDIAGVTPLEPARAALELISPGATEHWVEAPARSS